MHQNGTTEATSISKHFMFVALEIHCLKTLFSADVIIKNKALGNIAIPLSPPFSWTFVELCKIQMSHRTCN